MPGRTSARYLRMGTASLRQLSTTEKMATILGPASLLPKCSQFLRLSKYFDRRHWTKPLRGNPVIQAFYFRRLGPVGR
jgi:hypothetical protein